jgi:superfamily I DNA/RNA helicase
MSILAGLNPQQKSAVEQIDGRLLVLAGAGSGKTRVLTLRMAYLIRELGKSPVSILGLTFTNKAASEMRHRLAGLVDAQLARQVTLCTFHSFCMQILRVEIHRLGYTSQFTLYDEKDVQRLVNMLARDALDRERDLPSLVPTMEAIAFAKNKGLAAEEISGTGSDWHDQFVRDLYKRLEGGMRAYNAVDFDSLLSLTVELFENHPHVLQCYQERFQYIMIDEYQDTNPVQYKLAHLLSSKHNNLCVVGDDDQSIYGWRGADVQNILDFADAKVIKIEQNYRSTNTILQAANAVICHNQKRHGKALWSDQGQGDSIEVFYAPTEVDEAQSVVYRLAKMREKYGFRWRDFAILYRSNALSTEFETALLKYGWKDADNWIRGIPYQVCGGTEFYERREVKDLFAYLRVLVNPLDQEALLRIINYPRRGIGEASLDALTAYNRTNKLSLWDVLVGVGGDEKVYEELRKNVCRRALSGVCAFLAVMEEAKERFNVPGEMGSSLEWLIGKIGYQKAIDEEVKSQQMRDFKWNNVKEFVLALTDYENRASAAYCETGHKASLHDYVTSSPLQRGWSGAAAAQAEDDSVLLMTFHSAKGLEFPVCFLVGMEDHIIPHEKSLKETGVEEERRLMYVAITRAKKFLTISMARRRKRLGVDAASRPSRFLFEIPKELMKMVKWDGVD